MCALRIFEKKIVLCKKGDEITGLDGTKQKNLKRKNSAKSSISAAGPRDVTHNYPPWEEKKGIDATP